MGKECGTCTKCCEGHLHANVLDQTLSPGNPCKFLTIGKGCNIHETRPVDPCRKFFCGWIQVPDMPEHFKPEHSGSILCNLELEGITYLVIINAPNEPSIEFLSWCVLHATTKSHNLLWFEGGRSWWFGSKEFSDLMNSRYNP